MAQTGFSHTDSADQIHQQVTSTHYGGEPRNPQLIGQANRMHVPPSAQLASREPGVGGEKHPAASVLTPLAEPSVEKYSSDINGVTAIRDQKGFHLTTRADYAAGGYRADKMEANRNAASAAADEAGHALGGGSASQDVAFNKGPGDVTKNMAAKGMKLPSNYAEPKP